MKNNDFDGCDDFLSKSNSVEIDMTWMSDCTVPILITGSKLQDRNYRIEIGRNRSKSVETGTTFRDIGRDTIEQASFDRNQYPIGVQNSNIQNRTDFDRNPRSESVEIDIIFWG